MATYLSWSDSPNVNFQKDQKTLTTVILMTMVNVFWSSWNGQCLLISLKWSASFDLLEMASVFWSSWNGQCLLIFLKWSVSVDLLEMVSVFWSFWKLTFNDSGQCLLIFLKVDIPGNQPFKNLNLIDYNS